MSKESSSVIIREKAQVQICSGDDEEVPCGSIFYSTSVSSQKLCVYVGGHNNVVQRSNNAWLGVAAGGQGGGSEGLALSNPDLGVNPLVFNPIPTTEFGDV